MSNITVIQDDIYAIKSQFNAALVDHSLNFEREAGFAMQVLTASEYAMKVAIGNRQSVVNAIINVAAIGISLNPAKKQAYLVPRDNKICLDISYMGLIDLAVQDGAVVWAKAELVYEQDGFTVNGAGTAPTHSYNPFSKERGLVIGAYCVAKLPGGDFLLETMSIEEINSIRDRSSAWKAWISKKSKCPWVTDPGEMSRKTVVKRGSKYWAAAGSRLDTAIQYLNTDGDEGLAPLVAEPVATPFDVCAALNAVEAVTNADEWNAVTKAEGKKAIEAKDRAGYSALMAAAKEKRAALLKAQEAVPA